ncbi:glycosyltransferase family 2 protein [Riemerella anatipestifer]|uniref:Glycosyltransferase family 2 protein n=2 Tax=Riemerella anatipestifer TaxID=34085 RepID=A0AAP6HCJ8_RIEAN|nr:glycosyltransferase family 2 protein [Riemerella anatipestifer]MCO7355473.1 glycosyltransferase [Riemerella anatipestifer]MCU7569595.1 glycosyltransferase [Riemerella anatipestifer]MCU7596855.1 glycosyltransferase [Riemerella anatipestifer]MCW0493977.1 glycosyltransferase [Riemerella anatipestifer]MCW0501837.1 glycosyltransferase [Riemerella anatipestifer]
MNDITTPLFSIITPVYNSADYLKKCINSVLAQTQKSWELLLIDDGSTDDSLSICEYFGKNHENILVYSQENRGVSAARNLGIERSRGKYLCFIDSDDWVDEDYLENFVRNMGEGNFMVVQDHKRILENGKEIIRSVNGFNNEIFTLPKDLSKLIKEYRYIQGYACGKLYIRELIFDNNLRFNKKVTMGEDEIFYHKYLQLIYKIIFIASDSYNYVARLNSLTSRHAGYTSEFMYTLECNKFYHYILKNDNSEANKKYFTDKFSRNFNHLLRTIIYHSRQYSRQERVQFLKDIYIANRESLRYLKGDTVLKKIDYFLFKMKMFYLLDIILILKTKYN